MTGYGFGRKPHTDDEGPAKPDTGDQRLNFTGIRRTPVLIDPAREEAALQRGDALGFVDRGAPGEIGEGRRRRRPAQPQVNVFIKGPKDTLDWFIEYTNQRGHRSYWQTLEEFRALVQSEHAEIENDPE